MRFLDTLCHSTSPLPCSPTIQPRYRFAIKGPLSSQHQNVRPANRPALLDHTKTLIPTHCSPPRQTQIPTITKGTESQRNQSCNKLQELMRKLFCNLQTDFLNTLSRSHNPMPQTTYTNYCLTLHFRFIPTIPVIQTNSQVPSSQQAPNSNESH